MPTRDLVRQARPTAAEQTTPPVEIAGQTTPPAEAERRQTVSLWRSLLEIPALAAVAVAIVVLVRLLLLQAFYIPSGSMLPQLQLQDKIVVSRLSYHLHGLDRGDIVVFNAPSNAPVEFTPPHGGSVLRRAARYVGERLGLVPASDQFIKRVIGLPGDIVEGHDGHVYVNGRLLLEPYLPPGDETSTFGPIKVPKGELWVMGDNRPGSADSRYFGPIRRSSIIGRAILRVWPLTHVSFL